MGTRSRLSPCAAPGRVSRSFWSARPCRATALATEPAPGKLLPFEAIPRSGHNAWLSLYQFWRSNSFQNFHHVMQKNFQSLGPIYRSVPQREAPGWGGGGLAGSLSLTPQAPCGVCCSRADGQQVSVLCSEGRTPWLEAPQQGSSCGAWLDGCL